MSDASTKHTQRFLLVKMQHPRSLEESGGSNGFWFYLEGVFVDEDVKPSLHLLGFTEENELLKQEDVTLTFPPPSPDSELILANQLTLLLQVHLGREKRSTEGRKEGRKKEGGLAQSMTDFIFFIQR